MADSTIDSELFVLSNAFGSPHPAYENKIPDGDGTFSGASSHNVATAAYPIGTAIRVWNNGDSAGVDGWSEFTYLKFALGSNAALAAKTICVMDSATEPFTVSNDPDDVLTLPTRFCAIGLSAMTTAYYGWFWTGGVCPESIESDLGGNYATDGNVAAGDICCHDLVADAIGFGPTVDTTGSVPENPCGYALAADA